MPKIRFIDRDFKAPTLSLIAQSNAILEEYAADNRVMTLRQLHYQHVSRCTEGYPNTMESYNRLKTAMNDGRLAGLVDWSHLEDLTRYLRRLSTWDDPKDMVQCAADSFRTDKWAEQAVRIEVWVEKDALVGVIGAACEPLEIPFFSTRGYPSASELWGTRLRILRYARAESKPTRILYLGDHDPSGLHITEDIENRLRVLGCGRNVVVERLALNQDQIAEHNPPPNPAKRSDSRYHKYVEETGLTDSWELDALDPAVLEQLITDRVRELRDDGVWDTSEEAQERMRAQLTAAAARWEEIEELLED